MPVERLLNDADFAGMARLIDAGSSTRDLSHRPPGHDCCDRCTRRRVADAHLAGPDQTDPLTRSLRSHLDPDLQCLHRLVTTHGGFHQEIVGSRHHLLVNQAGDRPKVVGDSNIHHPHLDSGVTREHIHAGAATQEIQHHLRRDFARIGAHPFSRHTMVGRKRKHDSARHSRFHFARDRGITHRGFFQPPQTTERFGQPIQARLRLRCDRLIHRLNACQHFLERHRVFSPVI